MRVLFVSSPGLGHINPMLPLSRALAERGHTVRWAVAAEFIPYLERLGISAMAAGVGERERWPEVRRLLGLTEPGQGHPPGFGGPQGFALLFGRVGAPHMADDLDRIVAAWPPDLLVHDMADLASAPVATRLGVRHVTHSWAWALTPETFEGAARVTATLWSERGLLPRADAGVYQHLFLHPYPIGLVSGPRPAGNLQPIRPARIEPTAPDDVPSWVKGLGEDAVYLTLGTIFNQADAMRTLVNAVAELDRELVVTTGPRVSVDDLGDLPRHCHAAPYIAQDAVLPHCSLVVSHAGAGTFLGAAAAGVPQVCLPQGADQFLNAAAAAQAGIGAWLPADRRGAADVLAAAQLVLGDPAYRARALTISAEIQAMPSADEVAVTVEDLATTLQPT